MNLAKQSLCGDFLRRLAQTGQEVQPTWKEDWLMTIRIHLTPEQETLLVPLYSRAVENRRLRPILVDPKAGEILGRIEYDFEALKIPAKTHLTLAIRAKQLDRYAHRYLARTPNPVVVHLGCGLDSRALRIGPLPGQWYDVDFPDVIELRRIFYQETSRYHMIGSSVLDAAWLEQVARASSACIIAEGLLMYLHEEDIRRLFITFHERLPSSEIVFDAYSRLTARSINNHPSIKRTGARVCWGIDDAREIERWHAGFQFLDEWYFTEAPEIGALNWDDQLAFRVMGLFKAARKAHRICRFLV
jgi:O-methyltransferase involved in polyketide biosynthesis